MIDMYGDPEYDEVMDAFRCKLCNTWWKHLDAHLANGHKIHPADYKKRFGLNRTQPFKSKAMREASSKRALKHKVYEKMCKTGKKGQFTKGDNSAQKYERRAQNKISMAKLHKKGLNWRDEPHPLTIAQQEEINFINNLLGYDDKGDIKI